MALGAGCGAAIRGMISTLQQRQASLRTAHFSHNELEKDVEQKEEEEVKRSHPAHGAFGASAASNASVIF